ncbi:Cysteine protease atg4 [Sorochytrium milnesiophthora]
MWSNIATTTARVMSRLESQLHELFRSDKTAPLNVAELSSERVVVVLGCEYRLSDTHALTALCEDVESRPWMTYRHSFLEIGDTRFSSDSGWGCMIRSGQSLMAEACLRATLQRSFRLGQLRPDADEDAMRDQYIKTKKVMSMFVDSTDGVFSIHNLASLGVRFDTAVGKWFGPTTIAQALRYSALEHGYSGMQIHVAQDAIVYCDQVDKLFQTSGSAAAPVLVLIPLRLGIDTLNEQYFGAIKACLASPFSVGIAGGRPASSLWFIGYEDNTLLCLDPHHTQRAILATADRPLHVADFSTCHYPAMVSTPAASGNNNNNSSTAASTSWLRSALFLSTSPTASATSAEEAPPTSPAAATPGQTTATSTLRVVSLQQVDPSMLVGFLLPDRAAWQEWRQWIYETRKQFEQKQPSEASSDLFLFDVASTTPSFTSEDEAEEDDDDEIAETERRDKSSDVE